MVEKRPIDKLKIQGFKSLQDVELELGRLNVLIGPNGSGKSNLISYFEMLREMTKKRLQLWVGKRGGADRVLWFGSNTTAQLASSIAIGESIYEFNLQPTDGDRFVFSGEHLRIVANGRTSSETFSGPGHIESSMFGLAAARGEQVCRNDFCRSVASAQVYHFHDTSSTARVKLTGQLHDNKALRNDASNLAAYLCMLRHAHEAEYNELVQIVRLAIPFFDDFVLEPEALNANSVMLKWRHKGFDYDFLPSQLSDGSLRFICLVTALLQPDPPATIIIDEPELGLHPYSIHLLGALLRQAAMRTQVIIATQSSLLLDEFEVDNLFTVELENGVSCFKRLEEKNFSEWLKDFSVGELWFKNVLGGGIP